MAPTELLLCLPGLNLAPIGLMQGVKWSLVKASTCGSDSGFTHEIVIPSRSTEMGRGVSGPGKFQEMQAFFTTRSIWLWLNRALLSA